MFVSRFNRQIFTHDGRFFLYGQVKYYEWGSPNGNNIYDEFKEMPSNWFRNGDDKVVDIVSGYHYNLVLTKSGKLHAQSYGLYRNIDDSLR